MYFYNILQMADQSSSESEQLQHKQPTSPPTNVVSVLTKMLEVHMPKAEEHENEPQTHKKKFGFFLDFPLDNQLPKCEIQIEDQMKIETAFIQALQKFKVLFAQRGYDFNAELSNYTLRLAKRNGKPKTDMPSIDLKQKFVDLKVANSSIQVKNPDCIKMHQEVTKSTSHYSIGSEIGEVLPEKKQQVLSEQELMRKQKKQNCMFSFC